MTAEWLNTAHDILRMECAPQDVTKVLRMFIFFSPFSTFKNYSNQLTRDIGRDLRNKDVCGSLVIQQKLGGGPGVPRGWVRTVGICELRATGGSVFRKFFCLMI